MEAIDTAQTFRRRAWLALALAAAAAGCTASLDADGGGSPSRGPSGSGGAAGAGSPGGGSNPGGGASMGTGGTSAGPGGPTTPPPTPPETEVRQDFEVPRGGARFVYVANRRRDTVAVIDSTGLGIRTVAVGDSPGYLATVPGQDVALVINSGTRDVNILRTAASGISAVSRVPVVGGANRVSVARDGRHAVAWYDSALAGTGDRAVGGSFQEVSVLSLAPGMDAAFDLTVGFRPADVVFADDSSGAFVVTEDGISIIRFAAVTGPTVAPFVRFPDAGANAAKVVDVSVTPDGHWAVARREGASQVMLLDLTPAATGVRTVDLASPVTDLDLSPTGAFVLAVLRAENAYVRLPLPAAFDTGAVLDRHVLTGELVGSAALAADGNTAVLYTTAVEPPVERLVVVDLRPGATTAPLPVPLKKGVRAVAVAPDGKTAIVLHTKVAGDPADPNIDVEAQLDRSYGYTIVNLQSGFPKLQLTSAEVSSLALTPDGARAFVMVRGPRLVQRIALGSFIVDDFPVGSPPVALAVLGDAVKRVFVSQEHPEGRISFINWETGVVESVTGFELNGRIVQ